MKEKGEAYLEPLGGSENYEIWTGGKKTIYRRFVQTFVNIGVRDKIHNFLENYKKKVPNIQIMKKPTQPTIKSD